MTQEQFIEECKRFRDLARKAIKEKNDFIAEGVKFAPLQVGYRVKYKHRKSTEAIISNVGVTFHSDYLSYTYYGRPILKDGRLGEPTRCFFGGNTEEIKELIVKTTNND